MFDFQLLIFFIQWLEETFMKDFINKWEEQALNTPNLKTKEQRKLCLSIQTLEGLRITG